MIFDLALQAVRHEPREEDLIVALQRETDVPESRPYCTIDTALLRICRLIYLESKFVPVHNDIHDFYPVRWVMFRGTPDPGMSDLPPSPKIPLLLLFIFYYFFRCAVDV